MEQQEITKKIIGLNKVLFDNAFNTMMTVQNQTETMNNIILKNSPWIPEQGKEMFAEYNQIIKSNYDGLKKIVDDQFNVSV